eukprot:1191465-Alexandrium_andersonii.AAC.1
MSPRWAHGTCSPRTKCWARRACRMEARHPEAGVATGACLKPRSSTLPLAPATGRAPSGRSAG